jgi:hypothetical protein
LYEAKYGGASSTEWVRFWVLFWVKKIDFQGKGDGYELILFFSLPAAVITSKVIHQYHQALSFSREFTTINPSKAYE